jgi:hypothetical protein
VIEEADEALFWMELLVESGMIKEVLLQSLINEANELVAIFIVSGKTAKENNKKKLRVKKHQC